MFRMYSVHKSWGICMLCSYYTVPSEQTQICFSITIHALKWVSIKYYQDYELWLLTTKHRSKYMLGTAKPSPTHHNMLHYTYTVSTNKDYRLFLTYHDHDWYQNESVSIKFHVKLNETTNKTLNLLSAIWRTCPIKSWHKRDLELRVEVKDDKYLSSNNNNRQKCGKDKNSSENWSLFRYQNDSRSWIGIDKIKLQS